MEYYIAKVKYITTEEDNKGGQRTKKVTRKYLVQAVSIGDAEYIITKNLGTLAPADFTISGISEFDITDYFTKDSGKAGMENDINL